MAPTSTAPVGAPTSTDFDGDDFSNNLFSDLAPLLTLFGEQVTKQFLSLSFGWADHILLAMGPLGIITIVVSAIRVSGPRKLKAIIGRARETLTTAEVELLSSTSHDVCELWDGNQIVRAVGQPKYMKELIILKESDKDIEGTYGYLEFLDPGHPLADDCYRERILSLKDAVEKLHLEPTAYDLLRENDTILDDLIEQSPNITLNVAGATLSKFELWIWASIGLALQTAALIVPGLTVYLWDWKKGGEHIASYGYPCFLSGSLAIIIGALGCSYVIEKRTKEVTFRPDFAIEVRNILRIQKACTVGDQHFQSYAIFNEPSDCTLRTSRLIIKHGDHWSLFAAASTFATITGYIIQFVGLRSLHWSATIIQLGVTLAMTGCRAWVRRGLAARPICIPLEENHEAAWLTLFILTNDYDHQPNQESSEKHLRQVRGWELRGLNQTSEWQPGAGPEINTGRYKANTAVRLHTKQCRLLKQELADCAWANRLCVAVERIMKCITSTGDISMDPQGRIEKGQPLLWTIGTTHEWPNVEEDDLRSFGRLTARVAFRRADNGNGDQTTSKAWMVDTEEVYSIMELWALSLNQKANLNRNCLLPGGVLYPKVGAESSHLYCRILGQLSDAEKYIFLYSTKLSDLQLDGTKKIMTREELINMFDRMPPKLTANDAHGTSTHFLVTWRYYTVHQICAFELLHLFLLAIFSGISNREANTPPITKVVTILKNMEKPGTMSSRFRPFLFETKVMESISSCIVEAGLVATAVEANELVIAALSQYNLVPNREQTRPTTPPESRMYDGL